MLAKYLLTAVLILSSINFTKASPANQTATPTAMTQLQMDATANRSAQRADTELNETYRKLLAQAKPDKQALIKIKAQERAWIAYRDAYLDAMYPAKDKQAEYGSIFPMELDLLRAELTRRQVRALKELLKQYSQQ